MTQHSREHHEHAERPQWLDPGTAERLLDGTDVTAEDARVAALARVLAAAARPGPISSTHERAALAAFRAARDGQDAPRAAAQPRGTHRAGRWWAGRSRSVKVMIGGMAAVVSLGGVAVAEQTGALPHPFHSGAAQPRPTAGPSGGTGPRTGSGAAGRTPGGTATTPPASTSAGTPATSAGASPSATPGIIGVRDLCRAYAERTAKGRSLDAAAEARLERAAGGKKKIPSFCASATTSSGGGHTKEPAPKATTPSPSVTPATPEPRASTPDVVPEATPTAKLDLASATPTPHPRDK